MKAVVCQVEAECERECREPAPWRACIVYTVEGAADKFDQRGSQPLPWITSPRPGSSALFHSSSTSTGVDYMPWTRSLSGRNHAVAMRAEQVSAAFGRILREQRNAAGVSQEQLALSADVDRTFVSQMERGIRQPTLTTLFKLARALEIQPSTLVSRAEKMLR